MIEVIWGTRKEKPFTSEELAKNIENLSDFNGLLFIGYPIIGTSQGPFSVDALLITREHGIIVFDLIEGKDTSGLEDRQDDAYTKLKSKLIQNRELTSRRDLNVPIITVSFAPAAPNTIETRSDENLFCSDLDSLREILDQNQNEFEIYEKTLSVIQAITGIRRGRKRHLESPSSRGAKIKKIEDSIANLDARQSRAVIETYEGVQRIRGLAGSGKTIVLALKVAYLHSQHREWKIGITFNTRALKGYLKKLITEFVFEQTNEEPDWDNIDILNAWGAPGTEERAGIYFNFCTENGSHYYDYGEAKNKWGFNFAFRGAVSTALSQTKEIKEKYDALLVDEAQDFFPEFLQLCYKITKPPKMLIYAYDELQNLSNGDSLPPPEEMFGKDDEGNPLVSFEENPKGVRGPRQDIILQKCYRNSLPVLTAAHALGFGIYAEGGDLVQIFEKPYLWREIGYEVIDGKLEDDAHVILSRTEESSPSFLHEHSEVDDLIIFKSFDDLKSQNDWVVDQIQKDIEEEELRPEDIIVINANPLETRDAVAPVRNRLTHREIKSEIAGISTSPDIFFSKDSVVCTGIFRAKGNEAPMVYIINSEYYYAGRAIAERRNALFTAITRSKAWVRVVGVGSGMSELENEYQRVKSHKFTLDFNYPNSVQRRKMRTINRDASKHEKKMVEQGKTSIDEVIKLVSEGKASIDDFKEQLDLLKKLVDK